MQKKRSVRKQMQKRTSIAGWLYLIVLLTAAVFFSCTSNNDNSKLHVYAASSMNQVLTEVFDSAMCQDVSINASSSGMLARQISAGAPCDLYLSANKKWVDFLLTKNLIDSSDVEIMAQNRLVLVVKSSKNYLSKNNDWKNTLLNSNIVSIGDPDHVPAGIYASQVLKYHGIDADIKPKLIEGKDVMSALRLVQMGEADCGFVYKTDALSAKGVRILAEMVPESHSPIVYYKVYLSDKAKRFMADPNLRRRLGKVLQEKGFI